MYIGPSNKRTLLEDDPLRREPSEKGTLLEDNPLRRGPSLRTTLLEETLFTFTIIDTVHRPNIHYPIMLMHVKFLCTI